jgi:hypothetical protein
MRETTVQHNDDDLSAAGSEPRRFSKRLSQTAVQSKPSS